MVDSLEGKMARVSKAREQEREQHHTSFSAKSLSRLQRVAAKKMRSSFVGTLPILEHFFGHLWAHGTDNAELTDLQIRWRAIWSKVRTAILDNGNDQLKALERELSEYEVKWLSFQATMVPVSRTLRNADQAASNER